MPNDDYIKRSDALKAILGVSIYDTIEELDGARTIAENTWADGLYDAYKIIEEEVDAADVEPVRRGRWVKMTGMMPPEFTGHYQCSECDWFCKKHSIKETDFDFCPGCGADMRKRNEDAE
jgi:hypothetical protein